MSDLILITGSEGLSGTALRRVLLTPQLRIRRFDRLRDRQAILEPATLAPAVRGCAGIIHLAAVSRTRAGKGDRNGALR